MSISLKGPKEDDVIYLAISITALSASVGLHIIWCRVMKGPGLRITSFFLIGFVLFGFYWYRIQFLSFPGSTGWFHDLLWGSPLQLTGAFFYLSGMVFYAILYHTIFIDSPTRFILKFLESASSAGMKEIQDAVSKQGFIERRMDALIQCGYVKEDKENYWLTPLGAMVGRIYTVFQKIVNRPMGG